jgi:hypothetical protein
MMRSGMFIALPGLEAERSVACRDQSPLLVAADLGLLMLEVPTVPRDSPSYLALEGRGGGAHLKGSPRLAPHSLLTALACARALLDQLETVMHASNDERTRDVVLQVAEHLARLASTMTLWQADR